VVASGLVSGRPPEPNWLAPAALPFLAVAAVALASNRHRRWIVPLYVAPAIVGLVVWCTPFERGPFARVPRRGPPPVAHAPAYALPSWTCVHRHDCAEIDAMFRTSAMRSHR